MDVIRQDQLFSLNFKVLILLQLRHCSHIVFDTLLWVVKVCFINTNTVTVVMNAIKKTYKEFLSQNNQVMILYWLERADQLKI